MKPRYTAVMQNKRIGLFGGTFHPPHLAHLILADEAARQFGLSRVLWMLAPQPPHKLGERITPLEHRASMLQLAIRDNPLFEFSTLEIERPGPHYTVDTLEALQQREPSADIYLLMGGDSLRDIPSWRRSADLIKAAKKIGVLRRPDDLFDFENIPETLRALLREKTLFINSHLHNLSSTEIRRRAASNEAYRYYVHPAVYEYIESNGVYSETSGKI